ncbi:GNAT family N-acetyltransferase [Streptomyces sp. NPDC048718]|uniref:GNAT family N-acetyltransferase n=1 Tax=Streptomyces sp. NPDC048718 TaxID=3365587 RepID=UPI00371EBDE6
MLTRLETFYDSIPRTGSRAEDFGPLTLFVREGAGWPYYARPTLGHAGEVPVAAVERVRARQRELGVPEAFEWVAEATPGLRAAVEATGLPVHEHPLMVLEPAEERRLPRPEGVVIRVVEPADPALESALAAQCAAFGAPLAPDAVAATAARIEAGLTRLVAAVDANGTALAAGQLQSAGPVTEVVGIGTRPAARRRGLGLAVTAALVEDARARGAETIFLSATDASVARLYARLGFRTIATALIAEA